MVLLPPLPKASRLSSSAACKEFKQGKHLVRLNIMGCPRGMEKPQGKLCKNGIFQREAQQVTWEESQCPVWKQRINAFSEGREEK